MIRLVDHTEYLPPAPLRIAILGCGNVGAEVARHLAGRDGIIITRVLVRDTGRSRPIAHALLTDSFDEVLASEPEVVIELLGGVEPARSHIEAALSRGISVITANKSIIARHGESLHRLAALHGARLLSEASVGAGTPILAALDRLRGDRITAIRGIVNGTCNFILTRMEATGGELHEALREAQRLGYAEPDPAADLTGRDSAEKLCVLAQRAGWGWIHPDAIATRGITTITAEDVRHARRQRCVIRLLAEAQRSDDGTVSLRVGPCFVPAAQRLARLSGCENAFEIESQLAGCIHVQGPGAGPRATTSAILGDLHSLTASPNGAAATPRSLRRARLTQPGALRRHYIRADAPAGPVDPGMLLDVLNRKGIRADALDLRSTRTTIHTVAVSSDAAADLAESLAGGHADRCLVAPLME